MNEKAIPGADSTLLLTLDRGSNGAYCASLVREWDGYEVCTGRSAATGVDELRSGLASVLARSVEEPPPESALREMGTGLASLLLPPPVVEALSSMTRGSEAERPSISLRLSVRAPELRDLPWEYVYTPPERSPLGGLAGFVALSRQVSLVRNGGEPAATEIPGLRSLKILVAWADPRAGGYGSLGHIHEEVEAVRRAAAHSLGQPSELRVLPYAGKAALYHALLDDPPHVFHFIGHGDLRPTGGVLVLHGHEPGAEAVVYAEELARWLSGRTTRLAVLSACRTASSERGVALSLVKRSIPAVVAMQAPWSDRAAGAFTEAFYTRLLAEACVERAVAAGRAAIEPSSAQWGVPVLFRRGSGPLFDPAQATPARPHNLPAPAVRFIGRARELSVLRRRLLSKHERLLTVTGVGGMGKSTLVRRAGEELLGAFEDGVWLVDCGGLTRSEQVVAAICAALSVTPQFGSPEDALISRLRARRLLLILDGFEDAAAHADLVGRILRASPGVRCLVSSRVMLGIEGEQAFPLGPMPSTEKSQRRIPDGVRLFAETASRVVDGFTIGGSNRASVRRICEAVDGVPLAIVLAAARLRVLSLEELLEQMSGRAPLAEAGAPARPVHSELDSVIDSSLRLLGPQDRSLLECFAVFEGGFTIDDATSICGAESALPVLDGLLRLRERSLVEVTPEPGHTRYRLLDTIRAHLRGRVRDTEGWRRISERHAVHFAGVAVRIDELMREGHWQEGSRRFNASIGNLRAAIAYSIEAGLSAPLLQLVDGLGRILLEAGLWAELEAMAAAVSPILSERPNPYVNQRLVARLGALARRRGREEEARELWTRRLALCARLGDAHACIDTMLDLAKQAQEMGEFDEAEKRLRAAVRRTRGLGDRELTAIAYAMQADVALDRGDLRRALRRIEESCRLLPSDADKDTDIHVHLTRGRVLTACVRFEEAGAALRSVLCKAMEGDRTFGCGWALVALGELWERQGRREEAVRAYAAAGAIHGDLPTRLNAAVTEKLQNLNREAADIPSCQSNEGSWREAALKCMEVI